MNQQIPLVHLNQHHLENKERHMNNKNEKWDRRFLELAKLASTWSKDPSTQVGAVVVNWDKQQEFIGYNGFPSGVEDTPVGGSR